MTATERQSGGRPPGGALENLPGAWVGLVMAFSAYGLFMSVPLIGDHADLPPRVREFVLGNLAGEAVTIVWGGFVLAQLRSPRFAGQFTVWQWVQILWIAVRQIYMLAAPDFLFSPLALAYAGFEIAAGLFCLHIVRPAARSVPVSPLVTHPAGSPSLPGTILMAILGVVLGGIVGGGIGLGVGVGIVEITDMSCFEGACGFFAFFVAQAGVLVGAIAGGVLAAWRFRRRRA